MDDKEIGVGLGFRDRYRAEVFLNRERIDLLEITADHYLEANDVKKTELDLLKSNFVLVPHSLDLSLGSAEGLDHRYVEQLAELVEYLDPPWISDHFCFTRSGGVKIGHLAPVPFTRESVAVFVNNIHRLRQTVSTPIILENIAYLMRFPSSEMSETEFISRISDETGCGLLLDVTNLYVNSVNFGFGWREFLDEIPMDRVVQVHFVGTRKHGKRLIDAHSDRTQDEIWQVFRDVCERTTVRAAILERDADFPPFGELLEEVDSARAIMETARCL